MSERPGVYSTLDASKAVSALPGDAKVIGIIANAKQGTKGDKYVILGYADAEKTFGTDSEFTDMTNLIYHLFKNGAKKVIAVPAAVPTSTETKATDADYQSALDALLKEEAVQIIVTDSTELTVHAKIKTHVEDASADTKERIAVVGGASGKTATEVVTAATAINSSRVVYVDPAPLADDATTQLSGAYMAATVAAQIAVNVDPALPMTGVELKGFGGLEVKRTGNEIEALLGGGVTAIETINGRIQIVRAVTTYTQDAGGNPDTTWQELTTTLIADDVITTVRNALAVKYRRAKNSEAKRSSIKTEVATILESKLNAEIIEEYTEPSVTKNSSNPTWCDVDFGFNVMDPLNQIHISAHMTV